MKTAILISGHMRSFDRCLPALHWHVFRHFSDADFFVSTVADDDAPKAQVLRTQYPKARVEIECVPEQPDCIADLRARGCQLPKEWTRGQPYMHEPYPISVRPQSVARQLWQLEQCWKLFTSTADKSEYGTVIRCRPDLWFHSLQWPHASNILHWSDDFGARSGCVVAPSPQQSYVPWWGRFGGQNDRFAIMGTIAAEAYFTTYSRIPAHLANGCPLHPESLIAASLASPLLRVLTLATEFSTLRANGEVRPPEINQWDIAHAALNRVA